MMTKEEVAEILHYYKSKGITHREKLKELGIAPWKFYEYKAKYAAEETAGSTGALPQLAGNSEVILYTPPLKKQKSPLPRAQTHKTNLNT